MGGQLHVFTFIRKASLLSPGNALESYRWELRVRIIVTDLDRGTDPDPLHDTEGLGAR